jgi:hypothetical protein
VATSSTTLINDTVNGNSARGGDGGQGGGGNIGKIFGGHGGAGGSGGDGQGGGLDVAAGTVGLINDTLASNAVRGGNGGIAGNGGGGPGGSGSSHGGPGGKGGNGGNGAGGGLYLVSRSTVNLANTLIAEDTVAIGAGGKGGANGNTDVTDGASGSGGSASGYDVYGSVNSSDHDLIGNSIGSSGFSAAHGDILDPLSAALEPLANNGGAAAGAPGTQQVVQTMALLTGSPAINTGDNNASGLPATDQRGNPRIAGTAVDIGAFEVQPPAPQHSPPPPSPSPHPASPPTLHTPPLLAFFDSFLAGVETVNGNRTETLVDRIFGIPLLISTYDGAGNLMRVTLFGIDITFLVEML